MTTVLLLSKLYLYQDRPRGSIPTAMHLNVGWQQACVLYDDVVRYHDGVLECMQCCRFTVCVHTSANTYGLTQWASCTCLELPLRTNQEENGLGLCK